MNNKVFTPKYDNDLIPFWYFKQELINAKSYMVGEAIVFTGNVLPEGWFICDGTLISRTKYKRLFDVIGTKFGSGDGTTTFALPDWCNGDLEESDPVWIIKY